MPVIGPRSWAARFLWARADCFGCGKDERLSGGAPIPTRHSEGTEESRSLLEKPRCGEERDPSLAFGMTDCGAARLSGNVIPKELRNLVLRQMACTPRKWLQRRALYQMPPRCCARECRHSRARVFSCSATMISKGASVRRARSSSPDRSWLENTSLASPVSKSKPTSTA
jgi:hypothetical protein